MTTLTRTDDITEYLFSRVGFEPTEKQIPIIECRKRFILVAGGEQAGKSMIASKYLVSRFLETEEPGLYWLVAALTMNAPGQSLTILFRTLLLLGYLQRYQNV